MSEFPNPQSAPEPGVSSRQWGMLAHLLSLLGYLVAIGHFVPPLVIYLTKRNDDAFVADQARESLNFQITYFLAAIAATVVIFVTVLTCVLAPLGWLIGIALPIAHLVLVIVAGLKASEGVRYRYPFALRLV